MAEFHETTPPAGMRRRGGAAMRLRGLFRKELLQVLRDSVRKAGIREVHSHVAQFDGDGSPPGFAAVVLIDESHVSAHCYSDRGLLAIDIFTCGGNDPAPLADDIHEALRSAVPGLVLSGREHIDRLSALE